LLDAALTGSAEVALVGAESSVGLVSVSDMANTGWAVGNGPKGRRINQYCIPLLIPGLQCGVRFGRGGEDDRAVPSGRIDGMYVCRVEVGICGQVGEGG
jgi:hypothetical protein